MIQIFLVCIVDFRDAAEHCCSVCARARRGVCFCAEMRLRHTLSAPRLVFQQDGRAAGIDADVLQLRPPSCSFPRPPILF